MAKKKMHLGIPAPQSAADVAAQQQLLTQGASNAAMMLQAAQQKIADSTRLNMIQETALASFVERLAKTDPVEAAAINAVVAPPQGTGSGNTASDISAIAQIIANAQRAK